MDTKYFLEALRNWQISNHDSRGWEKLSQAERSEIMRDAQGLKEKDSFPARRECSQLGYNFDAPMSDKEIDRIRRNRRAS